MDLSGSINVAIVVNKILNSRFFKKMLTKVVNKNCEQQLFLARANSLYNPFCGSQVSCLSVSVCVPV